MEIRPLYRFVWDYLGPWVIIRRPNMETAEVRDLFHPATPPCIVQVHQMSHSGPDLTWEEVYAGRAIEYVDEQYVLSHENAPNNSQLMAARITSHIKQIVEEDATASTA